MDRLYETVILAIFARQMALGSLDATATVDGFIQEAITEQGMQYLSDNFSFAMGHPVTIELDPAHGIMHVRALQVNEPQSPLAMQLDTETETSQQTTTTDHPAAAGGRNPPRPMNCWMLYRDSTQKELKAKNPELTVQQISVICSRAWANLSKEERDHWKAQAKMAKELHERMFPDYKYSPRKPGQKKKRQSRKTTQAAATIVDATEAFDFNSFPDTTMMTAETEPTSEAVTPDTAMMTIDTDPTSEAVANPVSEAVTDVFTVDVSTALPNDAAHISEVNGLEGMESQEPMSPEHLRDAESLRQARLEAEFSNPEFESFINWDVEPTLAFRDGADEKAAMPRFSEDNY